MLEKKENGFLNIRYIKFKSNLVFLQLFDFNVIQTYSLILIVPKERLITKVATKYETLA